MARHPLWADVNHILLSMRGKFRTNACAFARFLHIKNDRTFTAFVAINREPYFNGQLTGQ
jgi:hypothetical protein